MNKNDVKKRLEKLQTQVKAMQSDPLLNELTKEPLEDYKKLILELNRLRRQQTRLGKDKKNIHTVDDL